MTGSDPTRSDERRRKEKADRTDGSGKRKTESALSRFSKRLKKKTEFQPFRDLPDNEQFNGDVPPKLEGSICLKRCKKHRLNRTKRFYGKLALGVLKLYKGRNTKSNVDTLNHEFKIDLSQISVGFCDQEQRFSMTFKQESHQLYPAEKSEYETWKEMLLKHRLYRQDQIRQGMVNNSELSARLVLPRPVTPSLDTKENNKSTRTEEKEKTDKTEEIKIEEKPADPMNKALDEIRATRSSVNDALEKMVKLHDEMKVMYSNTQVMFDEIKVVMAPQAQNPPQASQYVQPQMNKPVVLTKDSSAVTSGTSTGTPVVTSITSVVSATELTEASDSESDSDSEEEEVNGIGDPAASTRSLEATRNEASKKSQHRRPKKKESIKKKAPGPVLIPASEPVVGPQPQPQSKDVSPKYELIRGPADQRFQGPAPAPAKPPPPPPEPVKAPEPEVQKPQPPPPEPVKPTPPPVATPAPPKPKAPTPKAPAPVVQKPKPSPYQPRRRNHREALPAEQLKGEGISYSSLATMAFRGGLPINTYEPLGVLQVMCEEMRFASPFLSRAAASNDPVDRMCLIAAFAVSGYSNTVGRNRKPFNPLLGETFEYTSDDGWRYYAEQVSHHPPVSACYADGPGWEFWQTLAGQPKTGWKNVELTPEFPARLRLNGKEDYSWNKVKTTVMNATAAPDKRVLRHEGIMTVRCSNGVNARIEFKGDKNVVMGTISGPTGQVRISGSWDRGVYKQCGGTQECLFEIPPPLPNSSRFYGFSRFSMTLNEVFPEEIATIPMTDSRFRPDQRALENGEAQKAAAAKAALEQNQRSRARFPHRPVWFSCRRDAFTDYDMWLTHGRYWQSKEEQFKDTAGAMVKVFMI